MSLSVEGRDVVLPGGGCGSGRAVRLQILLYSSGELSLFELVAAPRARRRGVRIAPAEGTDHIEAQVLEACRPMKARGFTLIEVMVALFVIALGVGALLTTWCRLRTPWATCATAPSRSGLRSTGSANCAWPTSRPAIGTTRDAVEYAGVNWSVEQTISEAGIGDLLRVDVRVATARRWRRRADQH